MNPEHIEAAAVMILRRHKWDHWGFKTALELCEHQATRCYRQARWLMGLENEP